MALIVAEWENRCVGLAVGRGWEWWLLEVFWSGDCVVCRRWGRGKLVVEVVALEV